MPDLTPEELHAIDIACMHLLEAARRGRKKQQYYISIDNDPVGAASMEAAVRSADAARVTLRALLAKQKDLLTLAKWVRDNMEPLGKDPGDGVSGWRHMDAIEVDSIVSGVLHFCDEAIAKAEGRE